MNDLTALFNAVIALLMTLITTFFIPWLRRRTTAQDREELLKWVEIAVAAAQQLYHQLDGEARLDYALSILEQRGFDVDDETVRSAVEAAVLKLHRELEG